MLVLDLEEFITDEYKNKFGYTDDEIWCFFSSDKKNILYLNKERIKCSKAVAKEDGMYILKSDTHGDIIVDRDFIKVGETSYPLTEEQYNNTVDYIIPRLICE